MLVRKAAVNQPRAKASDIFNDYYERRSQASDVRRSQPLFADVGGRRIVGKGKAAKT